MMNYQYPTTYMLENPDHLLKIAPTPPPILPSLDQNEIEQTLYQRRVSDANGIEAITDSLQPLQINYGSNNYYQQQQNQQSQQSHYAPPTAQRSAPVQGNSVLSTQSAVLFSKTPRCPINNVNITHSQNQQQKIVVSNNVKNNNINSSNNDCKPPTTPPPPPMLNMSQSAKVATNSVQSPSSNTIRPSLNAISHSSNTSDIVAITPHSVHHTNMNSNSASNHSTASNNTSATTVIESAVSHSSHSAHSHHSQSPHNNHNNNNNNNNVVNNNNNKQNGGSSSTALVAPKGGITSVPKLAPPQLANPLPCSTTRNKLVGDNIIIPLETQQYNALLTQMYGNQVPSIQQQSINPYNIHQTTQFNNHTIHDPSNNTNNQYQNQYVQPRNNGYNHQQTQDIYSGYDTNPYGLYNTPPLPTNNGYYNNSTQSTNYYSQQPQTAPAHILQHNQYNTQSQIPKSADISYPPTNQYNHQTNNHYNANVHHQQHSNNSYRQQNNNNNNNNNYYQQQRNSHSSTHNLNHQSPTKVTAATASITSPHSQFNSNGHSSSHSKSPQQRQLLETDEIGIENAQFLHRCDGTIISPHSDPNMIQELIHSFNHKEDELDAFTAGDDALFGNHMVTIINVNWQTNIPYATVRIHISNRIHHVPLMDLAHIHSNKSRMNQRGGGAGKNKNNARYRLGINGNNINKLNHQQQQQSNVTKTEGETGGNGNVNGGNIEIGTTVIRRNPKLSDETLMKLPHLRKHREYIRTIDVNMGPKDYNSYRVSVNSKNNTGSDDDNSESNNNNNNNNCGRTANIQNLNAKQPSNNNNNNGDLNANNHNNRKKNKRMSACEKGDLFKTELCENWVKKGHCTYGKKCHFAHGRDDIRTRWRIENYKTQPCCDPARADSRLCLFGKRCNYAHPGEPLRRSHHCLYLDEEYQQEILKDYGQTTPYPFGIYI